MLLKRSLILAAGVLLFIVGFISYFQVSHMRMEDRFRAEREKFNIHQGDILTVSDQATPRPAAVAPAPADTNAAAATPDTNAATAAADTNSAPAAPDTNSAPATPDMNSTPATPDSNAAPATPAAPASTMAYPQSSRSPFFQLASYHPSANVEIQFATAQMGAVTAAPAPAPSSCRRRSHSHPPNQHRACREPIGDSCQAGRQSHRPALSPVQGSGRTDSRQVSVDDERRCL